MSLPARWTAHSAKKAFESLNGVFCIYKPPGSRLPDLVSSLSISILRSINALPQPPVNELVSLEPNVTESDGLPSVVVRPDLREHPSVIGDYYNIHDLTFAWVDRLDRWSSGVTLLTVGDGNRLIRRIRNAMLIRTYHVKGVFGRATSTFRFTGRVLERSTWKHISHARMDRVIGYIQSSHQQQMYHHIGVDLQSEEAYNLAAKGLIRPKDTSSPPIIYSVKCIDFGPPSRPEFTIEVHTINERGGQFLRYLVHNIGLQLKSTAACTIVRRIRYGPFTVNHSLSRTDLTIDNIVASIYQSKGLLFKVKRFSPELVAG